jgi:hypothetical protein
MNQVHTLGTFAFFCKQTGRKVSELNSCKHSRN